MKRITSVIAALCIALLLCACNQKGNDGSDVQDSSGAATVSGVFGYHIEYDAPPAGMSVTCAQTASGDSVYIAGFSNGDVLHFGKLSSGEFEEYQLPKASATYMQSPFAAMSYGCLRATAPVTGRARRTCFSTTNRSATGYF